MNPWVQVKKNMSSFSQWGMKSVANALLFYYFCTIHLMNIVWELESSNFYVSRMAWKCLYFRVSNSLRNWMRKVKKMSKMYSIFDSAVWPKNWKLATTKHYLLPNWIWHQNTRCSDWNVSNVYNFQLLVYNFLKNASQTHFGMVSKLHHFNVPSSPKFNKQKIQDRRGNNSAEWVVY